MNGECFVMRKIMKSELIGITFLCNDMHSILSRLSLFLFACAAVSCSEEEATVPRPRGYYRIDLPPKAYRPYEGACPFRFEYPEYSRFDTSSGRGCEAVNIDFPRFRAKIHLTYKPVERNILDLLNDSRMLAYKHTLKASGISEFVVRQSEKKVYGMIYEIGGNAASSIQFHVTDSSRHFLRGSLYFFAEPNADSINPVLSFIRTDIEHLLKTFRWKE